MQEHPLVLRANVKPRKPFGFEFGYYDTNGVWQEEDITGETIYFSLVYRDGTTVIAFTNDNVTIVSGSAGQAQYSWTIADINAMIAKITEGRDGTFYAHFGIADGTGTSGGQDLGPIRGRSMKIFATLAEGIS
jgi:hypothetical protein